MANRDDAYERVHQKITIQEVKHILRLQLVLRAAILSMAIAGSATAVLLPLLWLALVLMRGSAVVGVVRIAVAAHQRASCTSV